MLRKSLCRDLRNARNVKGAQGEKKAALRKGIKHDPMGSSPDDWEFAIHSISEHHDLDDSTVGCRDRQNDKAMLPKKLVKIAFHWSKEVV